MPGGQFSPMPNQATEATRGPGAFPILPWNVGSTVTTLQAGGSNRFAVMALLLLSRWKLLPPAMGGWCLQY